MRLFHERSSKAMKMKRLHDLNFCGVKNRQIDHNEHGQRGCHLHHRPATVQNITHSVNSAIQ